MIISSEHIWHVLLLFSILLIPFGCSFYDIESCPPESFAVEDGSLTLEEAKEIFYSSGGDDMCGGAIFSRYLLAYDIKQVIWNDAVRYHNSYTEQDIVEVPFMEGRTICFFSWKNTRTAKLLDSNRKIVIARDCAGRTGAYFMTIVADSGYSRTNTNKYSPYEICNNGDMGYFSGLIIYSRLSGVIVRANRYDNGELIAEVSLYSLLRPYDLSQWGKMLASVTGGLSVISQGNNMLTRTSAVDSADFWWNNDSTAVEIDSSVCFGDTADVYDPFDPFDPFSDLDNGNPFSDDYNGYDEADPGCGGGNSGNSGNTSSSPDNQYAGIRIIGGTSAQVNDIILTFMDPRVKKYAPINSLLDKLNKSKVSISIQNEVLVKGVSVPASCSSPNASGMIIIRARADDVNRYFWTIFEELLHAYQYQVSPGWTAGDREFEAKVWTSLIYKDTGAFFGYNIDVCRAFIEYFGNQDNITYSRAENTFRSYPFSYYSDQYPMTSEMTDRLSHIKQFFNQ